MNAIARNKPEAVLDAPTVRRILLERQQLAGPPGRRLAAGELQAMIDKLGFVQVDSVNTVERAHHMILFARNQTYRPKMLHRLLEKERSLFENWTHDAAVIPTAFYPYWRQKFRRDEARLRERWKQWRREGFEELFDVMLTHVERNGPTRSRDLTPENNQSGGWWNWHPEKTALEYLWRTGHLAISHREGFEKVYDLSHRVIPAEHHDGDVDHQAFVDWCCRAAIERLGVATTGEIAAFWGLIRPDEAKTWADSPAAKAFPTVEVSAVDGSRPRTALADPAVLEMDGAAIDVPARLRVLSPFDPVIRDRKRAMRLFGFDYRIEIFVPAAKRKYGYYVFPLLEGDRFVGRIDMKRTSPGGPLHVRKVWWEPGVRYSKGRIQRLAAELDRVRRFAEASDVTWAADALDQ
ncbi:winged helix-turn-helix domain-containing protein [Minwuia sp.]|uniref:winged helix-turn-helix domain-containing protein n=1 Tax=Minwuia sp. TaxID=2493630 RepID=UPI003A8F44CB